jgi:phosphomannomutase
MLQLLSELRHKVAIGFVGGSNLVKQQEQLAGPGINVTSLFDFCFAENGLTAYRLGEELASQSFIAWIGQDKYNKLVKWYVIMQRIGGLVFSCQPLPRSAVSKMSIY